MCLGMGAQVGTNTYIRHIYDIYTYIHTYIHTYIYIYIYIDRQRDRQTDIDSGLPTTIAVHTIPPYHTTRYIPHLS
jgi:hypothetical protein